MLLLTLVALWLLANVGAMAVAALIIGSAIVLLTLAEPRYGLYLAVLSVPVQQYGSLKGLTATQGAFLLVLGAWAAGKLLRGARWDVLRDANVWRFALFYVAILASGRVAGDIKATLTEGFHWGEALAIYVIARDTLRTRRDWAGLVACFFVGASGGGVHRHGAEQARPRQSLLLRRRHRALLRHLRPTELVRRVSRNDPPLRRDRLALGSVRPPGGGAAMARGARWAA